MVGEPHLNVGASIEWLQQNQRSPTVREVMHGTRKYTRCSTRMSVYRAQVDEYQRKG